MSTCERRELGGYETDLAALPRGRRVIWGSYVARRSRAARQGRDWRARQPCDDGRRTRTGGSSCAGGRNHGPAAPRDARGGGVRERPGPPRLRPDHFHSELLGSSAARPHRRARAVGAVLVGLRAAGDARAGPRLFGGRPVRAARPGQGAAVRARDGRVRAPASVSRESTPRPASSFDASRPRRGRDAESQRTGRSDAAAATWSVRAAGTATASWSTSATARNESKCLSGQ